MWTDSVDLDIDLGFGSGPLASSPSWSDVSTDVRSLTITRGRSSVHQTFDAGSVSVDFDNSGGEYDPNNSSATNYPNLTLGTPIRVQATHSMTTYNLFRGSISSWPLSYPMSGKDSIASLEGIENLGIIRSALLASAAYSQESTDTRIDNILDDIGWAAGARDLDSGVADVAAISDYTGSAGDLIDQAVEAEQGQFFIAGNGDATLQNRVALSGASSSATFNPGTNLDFQTVSVVYDKDTLYNKALITGADEVEQAASDSTSISNHGEQGYESTNASILDQANALNVAEFIVGNYKTVGSRIVGFSITPEEDPSNLWPVVLSLELQDVVTVVVTPPGGGDALSQAVAIEQIQHEITPGKWTVTYMCHPLSTFRSQSYWTLGSSDLGSETVLA